MPNLLRIFKHSWFDENHIKRLFGTHALPSLTEQVRASEQQHAGEIRICIEGGLPFQQAWRGYTPRQRANELFSLLRVWDTEKNNGVLVYLLLAEHAIEIVADRGLHQVNAHTWQTIIQKTEQAFRQGHFTAGLTQAIEHISNTLASHYPRTHNKQHNELADAPDIR